MSGKHAPRSGIFHSFPWDYLLHPTTSYLFPRRDPQFPAISHSFELNPMADTDQILEEAKRLEPDPPRSKLDDYAEIIWELRRKRKRICVIAEFLTSHGIRVGKSTVARWLKAHAAPKTNASSRQFLPPLSVEIQEPKKFFTQPPDSTYEKPRKYNIG
jgi:translation initiation factor 1 (eIF-1/SUI1)